MLKTIFLSSVLVVSLSGCMTTKSDLELALEKTLPVICKHVDTVHAAFSVATLTGKISEKNIERELAAYGTIKAFCDEPGDATIPGIVLKATAAYRTYLKIVEAGS